MIAKASGGLYDMLMRIAPAQKGRPKEVLIAISNYNLWPIGALPLWIKVSFRPRMSIQIDNFAGAIIFERECQLPLLMAFAGLVLLGSFDPGCAISCPSLAEGSVLHRCWDASDS